MGTPAKLMLIITLLGICAVAGGGVYAWNKYGATGAFKDVLAAVAQQSAVDRGSAAPVAPAATTLPVSAVDTVDLEPMSYTPFDQGWHILHTQQVWARPFTAMGEERMRFQLQSEGGAPFDFYLVRSTDYAAATQVVNGYTRLKAEGFRASLVQQSGQRRVEVLEQAVPAGDWVAVVVNAAHPAATIKVYAKFSVGEPLQPQRSRDARHPRQPRQVASGAAPRPSQRPVQTEQASTTDEPPAKKWVDPSTIPTGLASQECWVVQEAKAKKNEEKAGDPTWMSASAPINP